jgi:hypothetical protein
MKKKRRHLPEKRPEGSVAWHEWTADHMQQRERGLSPHDDTRPSPLILVPLLGLPALVIVGTILLFVLR